MTASHKMLPKGQGFTNKIGSRVLVNKGGLSLSLSLRESLRERAREKEREPRFESEILRKIRLLITINRRTAWIMVLTHLTHLPSEARKRLSCEHCTDI